MRGKLLAMIMLAGILPLAMVATASGATVYMLNIYDYREGPDYISATFFPALPAGSSLGLIQEGPGQEEGKVLLVLNHAAPATNQKYNIMEPPENTLVSDTLQIVNPDPNHAGKLFVEFKSGSLDDWIEAFPPETPTLGEVGMMNIALNGGDSLIISWVSPEPTSLVLLGAGVMSLLARGRRRQVT